MQYHIYRMMAAMLINFQKRKIGHLMLAVKKPKEMVCSASYFFLKNSTIYPAEIVSSFQTHLFDSRFRDREEQTGDDERRKKKAEGNFVHKF